MTPVPVSIAAIAIATFIAWRIIMSAIANLQAAAASLKSVLATLPAPGITPAEEAEVQAVADELTALAAKLAPPPAA